MADAFSLPMAEIAVLLGEGKLKARALADEAIANHERFGSKLMAYSQWAPEHARKCADAAFAVRFTGGLAARHSDFDQGSLRRRGLSDLCGLA